MHKVMDTAVYARYRVKISKADTQERVKFLWELADRLKMEPVDAEFGELYLKDAPTAKQLCAFMDLSEREGFAVESCVRI